MSRTLSITARLHLPQDPAFGRVVPKSKVYQYAGSSKRLRSLFVEQVEKIIHTSILAPKTVNLPARGAVKEIHVLTIVLRTPAPKPEILQAIDKAIPYPTLFILNWSGKICYTAAFKRPSEINPKKWVISSHFESDWLPEQSGPQNLPLALDLQSLYEQLIKSLIPLQSRDGESIESLIDRAQALLARQSQAAALEKRVADKRLQFNRRVELNTQLKNINQEIAKLRQ